MAATQQALLELPNILAIDLGGLPTTKGSKSGTGYCIFTPGDAVALQQAELNEPGHYTQLWDLLWNQSLLCQLHGRPLVVVYEPFQFRHDDRRRPKIDYTPATYEGVVLLFGRQVDEKTVTLVSQPASLVQPGTFWGDDDKLKTLGVWVPGRRHAMDATRHYLYYRTFTLGDNSILNMLKA